MATAGVEDVKQKIAGCIYEAHKQRKRGLVIVRCSSPGVVDRARETLMRVRAPFGWRSLPVAELDPPDLLGFVMHSGSPDGPCFLGYGLPKGMDGRIEPQFINLCNQRADAYFRQPTLMVLLVTLDEMRDASGPARTFWNSRDLLVAWPATPEKGQFLPATLLGRLTSSRAGGVAQQFLSGPASAALDDDLGEGLGEGFDASAAPGAPSGARALWAGCPFQPGDPSIPPYISDTKPPVGRRWGVDLVPEDAEGAEQLDACRQQLAARAVDQARTGLTKAAKRFRAHGEPLAAAECYVLLGMCGEQRVDLSVALEWYDVALNLYDQLEDAGYADVASMVGYLRFLAGDAERAQERFGAALERAERIDDEFRLASLHRRLGVIAENAGEHDAALEHYERASEIEERNGDQRARSRTLNNLARIHRTKGDLDNALDFLEQSIEIKEELGDDVGLASSYHELGNLRFEEQALDDALEAYERALELEVEQRDIAGIAYTQAQIGLVQRELFSFEESITAFMVARGLFRRLGSPHVATIEKALNSAAEMMDVWQVRQLDVAAQQLIDELLEP